MKQYLQQLHQGFSGEFYFDDTPMHQGQLRAYSTDASVYEEKPLAVAMPKTEQDIVLLVQFATKHAVTLIPRAAGTSLAGQVVGNGIVVDSGKYLNEIIELNVEEKWVRVQPGVIRDDLNKFLQPHGLMFGPETSTANRAMIGGMVGNNSCGLHSIVWGSVRDHLLEAKVVLSDGSMVIVDKETSHLSQSTNNPLLDNIKSKLFHLLQNDKHQKAIQDNFPKKTVSR
ncbi:MAG: FAD-binding oxidoreductase, partial [Deinococcales bacterium]|nr:FAD-binding oxidoreductase [Chitinophagaceae bacterium]